MHGITDNDLAGARCYRTVVSEFEEWAEAALFIGFGSDFDLAVLKAEHSRADLRWSPPRFLDLMRLVPLTSIRLPNFGLETVAGKLGVQAADRHRALSDAVMTAEVFLALIPMLREIGVNSFAEAERAAGKSSVISLPLRQEEAPEPADLANLDSFPFRRRVLDIMTAPPEITDQWHSDKELQRSDKKNPSSGGRPEGGCCVSAVPVFRRRSAFATCSLAAWTGADSCVPAARAGCSATGRP